MAGDNRRLFGKDVLHNGEKVQNGGFLSDESASVPYITATDIPTYVPEGRPADKVGMIDLALRVDVLARAHHHRLGRGYVDQRRLARVGVGHP